MLRDRLPGDGKQGRQAARARAGAPGQEFEQLTPARVRERREYAIRVSRLAGVPEGQRSARDRRPASSYCQPPLLPFHSSSLSASGRSSDVKPLSTTVTPSSSPTGRR